MCPQKKSNKVALYANDGKIIQITDGVTELIYKHTQNRIDEILKNEKLYIMMNFDEATG